MKKLLFVLLILSVVTSYAQIPSYVPTNGLVGYWPFNGNANDVSGNGNNGTVNGATLTADRNGNANNAYSFNGLNNYIQLPFLTAINNASKLTLSFWLNTNLAFPNSPFTVKSGAIFAHWIDNSAPSGPIGLQYSITASGQTGPAVIGGIGSGSISSIIPNTWSNIVFIFDGSQPSDKKLQLYVNGVFVEYIIQSPTLTITNLGSLANRSVIGANVGPYNGSPVYNFFNGKLDDIAIYNRALSQSEITGLYNAGTNTCLPSYLPTSGLVGYWPFCGNANDESGNGNNGTVNGATLTTDRFGNAGKAYRFGLNKYIDLGTGGLSENPTNCTFSAWYKIDSQYVGLYGQTSVILTKRQVDNGPSWTTLQISPDSVATVVVDLPSSIGNLKGNTNTFNGLWNNIVGVKAGNRYTLYFNGQLIKDSIFTLNQVGSTYNMFVGKHGAWNTYFYGLIDDIAIYNRALTATEIQNLYNSSAPTSCIANITNNDTTICRGQSVTLNSSAVASGSVTDINGNTYPTVNIGSQTWMQKNLNVSKYKNGDIIPQVTNATQWAALTTGAWCWYNNDSATYAATYGKLYNWYAVNDPRGLAPDGWHVPSDGEWNSMVKFLESTADTTCIRCYQGNLVGGWLKSTNNWIGTNVGADNRTGFTALPGGSRKYDGAFFPVGVGYTGFWWSGSLVNSNASMARSLDVSFSGIARADYLFTQGLSIRALRNTPTYLWSTGATTPTITVSPTVTTTYYLTVTDANGNTCRDSVKVFVNTAVPSAPATITGATDVCSNFSSTTSTTSNAVTYTAATVSTASSYTWTVPAGVTIVSGQGTNSISVTFANSFVSGTFSVVANNACGSSTSARTLVVYRRVAATPGTIQKEFSPTSIAAVTNVTGLVSETYRIRKVTYATSYNWSMNRGTSATITHINPLGANDTAVIVTFANCFLRDTLSVRSVTPCSISTVRTAILIAYTTPASVLGITTVGGNFATCIGTTKTFTAVRGTPTTTQAPIASFRWTRPANTTIVSATSDSASITVSFNTGYTGGSMSARGVSQCGTIGTTASTAILQFLPPSVLSIASSTGSYNACIGNSITYSALVSAPSTSQVAASVFRWTKPNNTTITSAAADSSTITLQFNTGYIGGTLSVRGQTSCGTLGTARNQSLTRTGCPAGTKMSVPVTTTTTNSFEVSLYPNPSAGEFKLMINAPLNKNKAIVKVIDIQGRLMKSFECNANQVTALGNELKPGVYMVEVRMGNEVKTVRAVRF